MLKISVITVCLNSSTTIEKSIVSVLNQTYQHYEHIFIDGGSTDGTVQLIEKLSARNSTIVSEPDRGIYDAMNKGYQYATGDIIAFLNSDDFYSTSDIFAAVVERFASDTSYSFVFGDLRMLDSRGKLKRYWKSSAKYESSVKFGQIPHPGFFASKKALDLLAQPFDSSMKISADLQQQLILIHSYGLIGSYVPKEFVTMRLGGASTGSCSLMFVGWRESATAYNKVFGRGGWIYVFLKVASKVGQIMRLSSHVSINFRSERNPPLPRKNNRGLD